MVEHEHVGNGGGGVLGVLLERIQERGDVTYRTVTETDLICWTVVNVI